MVKAMRRCELRTENNDIKYFNIKKYIYQQKI